MSTVTYPKITGVDDFESEINVLENKYVRTTRFEEIGSGTSGTVTLPPNSTVVLDDFGGTVDAVVTTMLGGRPTYESAVDAGGATISTTFDSSGNYVLSGTPSSYPVAIVYRVTQHLVDFDSDSTNIVGAPQISSSNSGLANTSLSNLTTTSINQSLIPDSDSTHTLGDNGLNWLSVSTRYISFNGNNYIDIPSGQIYTDAPLLSIDYFARGLYDNVGVQSFNWDSHTLNDGVGIKSLGGSDRTLVDSAGGLILDWSTFANFSSDVSGYVGRFSNIQLQGTSGDGLIAFPQQSTTPTAPANGYSQFASNLDEIAFKNSSGRTAFFSQSSMTANRTYTLPNNSGTFALTSDISSLTAQTANTVLAGPTSGAAALPTFRALVSADLPQAANLYARVATTANLTATYNNGSSGVGATLTNSGALAALSIDGVSLSVGQYVLVWNQTTGSENGLYTVTTVGSGSVAWVLTRATNFNGSAGGPLYQGATISVSEGTVYYGGIFILQTVGPYTIGTTSLVFLQNIAYNTLLTGLGSNQTVIGATTSGGTLTLSSTSNATKGNILFGTSAYNEANNRLGLGLTSPNVQLDASGWISGRTGVNVGASAWSSGVPLNGLNISTSGAVVQYNSDSGVGRSHSFRTNSSDRLTIADAQVTSLVNFRTQFDSTNHMTISVASGGLATLTAAGATGTNPTNGFTLTGSKTITGTNVTYNPIVTLGGTITDSVNSGNNNTPRFLVINPSLTYAGALTGGTDGQIVRIAPTINGSAGGDINNFAVTSIIPTIGSGTRHNNAIGLYITRSFSGTGNNNFIPIRTIGTGTFSIDDAANILSTSNAIALASTTAVASQFTFANGLRLQPSTGVTGAASGAMGTLGGISITPTSGEISQWQLNLSGAGFAPTSGTAIYNSFTINPTINQTGGANGITRGLYVNPTLTAAAAWRAIEANVANASLIVASTDNAGTSNTPTIRLMRTASSGSTKFEMGNSGSVYNAIISNSGGEIQYFVASGSYYPTFYSNGSEAMRLDTTGSLGIGATSINASAKVQIDSTTKGFLPPRMTTAQKASISSPATGLMVFDTTLAKLCVFTGSVWETVTSV